MKLRVFSCRIIRAFEICFPELLVQSLIFMKCQPKRPGTGIAIGSEGYFGDKAQVIINTIVSFLVIYKPPLIGETFLEMEGY